ncbi:MAG: LysM peptidoglycan-binding domain-containing protein [Pirellulales bacterium]
MQSLVKALLILGVLVSGIGLALFFRKSDSADTAEQNTAVKATQDNRLESQVAEVSNRQGVPPKTQGGEDGGGRKSPATSARADSRVFIQKDLAAATSDSLNPPGRASGPGMLRPPGLPPNFRPVPPTVKNSPRIADARSLDNLPSAVVGSSPTGGDGVVESHTAADALLSNLRTHTIVNGDTLARIAQRYLGTRSRDSEIYELNRDLISDSDVLPIGRTIRIPHRQKDLAAREAADNNSTTAPAPLVVLPRELLDRPD